jgi:hypothetical protein
MCIRLTVKIMILYRVRYRLWTSVTDSFTVPDRYWPLLTVTDRYRY